jgi:hypothetical protein
MDFRAHQIMDWRDRQEGCLSQRFPSTPVA